MYRHGGVSQARIGERVRLDYTAVSRERKRLRDRIEFDRRLKKRLRDRAGGTSITAGSDRIAFLQSYGKMQV
jgi:hypothetical protein